MPFCLFILLHCTLSGTVCPPGLALKAIFLYNNPSYIKGDTFMSDPILSIITVCYNSSDVLPDTLNSLLAREFDS